MATLSGPPHGGYQEIITLLLDEGTNVNAQGIKLNNLIGVLDSQCKDNEAKAMRQEREYETR